VYLHQEKTLLENVIAMKPTQKESDIARKSLDVLDRRKKKLIEDPSFFYDKFKDGDEEFMNMLVLPYMNWSRRQTPRSKLSLE
jgi:hypothetical protein